MFLEIVNLELVNIALAFLLAFAFTFFTIPSIIKIARTRIYNLNVDETGTYTKIPALGGIAIFAGTLLSLLIFIPEENSLHFQFMLVGLLIIFFLGIKDDFDPIGPYKKLFVQILVSYIFVFFADIRITNLHGIFSQFELSLVISQTLSILFFVFIINAFNFLDGINAFCGSISVLIAISFASWFYLSGSVEIVYLSVTLAGSVFAFLYYNITPAKIFLGDTGSLTIGSLIAILSIHFVELNAAFNLGNAQVQSAPVVLYGILIIPVSDAIRVVVMRIMRGSSPFQKDKKHIHHMLLDCGLSHMRATSILVITNLTFIIAAFTFQYLGNLKLLLLLLLMVVMLLGLVIYYKNRYIQKTNNSF